MRNGIVAIALTAALAMGCSNSVECKTTVSTLFGSGCGFGLTDCEDNVDYSIRCEAGVCVCFEGETTEVGSCNEPANCPSSGGLFGDNGHEFADFMNQCCGTDLEFD